MIPMPELKTDRLGGVDPAVNPQVVQCGVRLSRDGSV